MDGHIGDYTDGNDSVEKSLRWSRQVDVFASHSFEGKWRNIRGDRI
jgi:hypothetical protein